MRRTIFFNKWSRTTQYLVRHMKFSTVSIQTEFDSYSFYNNSSIHSVYDTWKVVKSSNLMKYSYAASVGDKTPLHRLRGDIYTNCKDKMSCICSTLTPLISYTSANSHVTYHSLFPPSNSLQTQSKHCQA